MGWEDVRDGNRLKHALAGGQTVVGAFVRMSAVEAAEVCAHAGCDFVITDAEHAAVSWSQAMAMMIATEAAGSVPIMRVSNWSRDLITRALDAGAHGVMVPQVETAEVAAAAVAATRYGPGGTRGTAGSRRNGFGLRMAYGEYVEAANAATAVILQVESMAAVENVDAIAAVPGIDCLFIGLTDLSVDLGVAGQYDAPEVDAAVDRVLSAGVANGVAIGVPTTSVEMAHGYLARGVRLVATGDSGLLGKAVRAYVEGVRSSSA